MSCEAMLQVSFYLSTFPFPMDSTLSLSNN